MAAAMSQQAVELPHSTRQDIVSALLNDYGSFEYDDAPSYNSHSPRSVSEDQPQPPPPPPPPPKTPERERKNSNEKPLPYAGHLNMRFQLRVDEPASPESPEGSPGSAGGLPRRINYRSISRESKPPSLKLLASNGSTAKVSAIPLSSTGAPKPVTPSRNPHNEQDKSLPPPPPEKSTRRPQQPASMGNHASADRPPRKDSLPSQDKIAAAEPVKRKPVPAKFTSLLDLKNNPRGGKGGPMPTPRSAQPTMEKSQEADLERPRTAVEAPVDGTLEKSENALVKSRSSEDAAPQVSIPSMNRLPPTPDEKPAPPPSSRKPGAGMGLPSNPRSKQSAAPSPSSARTPGPNTLTPGPTPSPMKTAQYSLRDVSPVTSVTTNEARPFSWEPARAPPPEQPKEPVLPAATSPPEAAPNSNIQVKENDDTASLSPLPPRTSSKLSPAFTGLPSQQTTLDSPISEEKPQPSTAPEVPAQPTIKTQTLEVDSPTTPFFTPLTIAPVFTAAAPITDKHLTCYTNHKQSVWSRNDFHPQACMVCTSNERERKWACAWCYLRICLNCSEELLKIQGRDVSVLLEKKKKANPEQEERGRERVRSMEVPGDRRRSPAPKRHDSGAGDHPVSAGIPSVAVWRADEESYGGDGYGPEEA